MKQRFERDYTEIVAEENRIKKERNISVSVQSLAGKLLITELEKLVKMWPTHDIRYMGYGTCDIDLMKDMIKSASLRVTRKDVTLGILEVTVEMLKNLDEIERYNSAISKHNQEWVAQGSPTEIFDPVHGDVHKVKDQYVDPVMMQSNHYALPKSAYSEVSTGKLADARPNLIRKSHIRVKYQVCYVSDKQFVLSYAAYDYNDKILYYNEVVHHDLAYLVRRSVQEMWGNPLAQNEFGELLSGVSMLVNGKKLSICKKDNKIPEFLAHEVTVVKDLSIIRDLEVEEEKQIVTGNVAAYYMPIVFIVGFVVCAIWSFFNMIPGRIHLLFRGGEGFICLMTEVLFKPPMFLCILFLIGTIYCRKIAQDAERNASELSSRGKFL
jgi:hypothetical protein